MTAAVTTRWTSAGRAPSRVCAATAASAAPAARRLRRGGDHPARRRQVVQRDLAALTVDLTEPLSARPATGSSTTATATRCSSYFFGHISNAIVRCSYAPSTSCSSPPAELN